jgi:hypothetical protein
MPAELGGCLLGGNVVIGLANVEDAGCALVDAEEGGVGGSIDMAGIGPAAASTPLPGP